VLFRSRGVDIVKVREILSSEIQEVRSDFFLKFFSFVLRSIM
jgi:hypothetical protein